MDFRTIVDIPQPPFSIRPMEQMLFVGSCFADEIGRRFQKELFQAVVNPYGVMYNPVSVTHSVKRFLAACEQVPQVVVITLGTNHVYILKETGEVVDNCQKRPQRLFDEVNLTIDECTNALERTMNAILEKNGDAKVIVTVSPIRYAKYGYHESQLSKATLLLAADRLVRHFPTNSYYFPAYEIMNDELRDYRFYKPDMLHPSDQAVEYIWQQCHDRLLSDEARQMVREWQPIKKALEHRPFNAESTEYKDFRKKAEEDKERLIEKYKI